jgi:hypothetical protein
MVSEPAFFKCIMITPLLSRGMPKSIRLNQQSTNRRIQTDTPANSEFTRKPFLPDIHGLNPISLKNKIDSVRDCLVQAPMSHNEGDKRAQFRSKGSNHTSDNFKMGSNFIFGMPMATLNKKDGRMLSDNATVEDTMSRSEVQKQSLLDQDMTTQRTREEVF